MRRFTVLFVLAFALALPAIASATEVGGSTSESFTLEAPTISMTVPVATVYNVNVPGHTASGDITLTNIGTNNINGLTITARFSVLTKTLVGSEVTPVTIPTTSRAFINMSFDPGLTIVDKFGGSIADDATRYEIASSTASLTGASAMYHMIIQDVTVPGDYTGSIDFLASTNP